MIHIKYRNETPLGDLVFPEGFYVEFYIDSTIERPQYPIQVEAREDQAMDVHKLFQRWDKQHTIRFMGVESLCDSVSMIPLMDYVYVNGVRVFDSFVDIRWEEDAECLANIEFTFSYQKIIKTP